MLANSGAWGCPLNQRTDTIHIRTDIGVDIMLSPSDISETMMMFSVTSTVTHFRFKNHRKLCLRGMPRHCFADDTSHFRAATSENGGSTWSATSPLAVMTSSPMWHCPEKTPPMCRRRGLHVAHFTAPRNHPEMHVLRRCLCVFEDVCICFYCVFDVLMSARHPFQRPLVFLDMIRDVIKNTRFL